MDRADKQKLRIADLKMGRAMNKLEAELHRITGGPKFGLLLMAVPLDQDVDDGLTLMQTNMELGDASDLLVATTRKVLERSAEPDRIVRAPDVQARSG